MKLHIAALALVTLLALVGIFWTVWILTHPHPDKIHITPAGSESYRVIKVLKSGFVLVEVQTEYVFDNPFPIGDPEVIIQVPHMVRLSPGDL